MSKLIFANLSRMKHDKIFWICSVLTFIAGIIASVMLYVESRVNGFENESESAFFAFTVIIAILFPVFVSLFIGTEYSDGTIRNKIVSGQKRSAVYLANLITATIIGAVICALYIVPYTCISIPLLGFFTCGITPIILFTLTSLALMIAFAAIFTLISMLCTSKAHSAVACILLSFLLLFMGIYITSSLNEPEYYDSFSYVENGIEVTGEKELNSHYVSGTEREIYEFLLDFIPGGQVIQLSGMTSEKPATLALYSLIIFGVTTGAGLVIFKKKDLK